LVLDSNDRERLDELREEMFKLLNSDELKDGILLIVANKQDLPNSMKIEELKSKLQLDRIRTMRAVNIIGTSAIKGDGIQECFVWLSHTLTMKTLQQPIKETYNDIKNISYFNILKDKMWNTFGYKTIENPNSSIA
jgi:signal recognition particle receptor subunit beta